MSWNAYVRTDVYICKEVKKAYQQRASIDGKQVINNSSLAAAGSNNDCPTSAYTAAGLHCMAAMLQSLHGL
jgi:hypothetical protein